MHVLPRLRRGRPWRPLSQLRRRIGAPADPAARPIAASPRRDAADTEAGRMHLDMSLRASRRGLVPPFIAMDVLRAANERAAGENAHYQPTPELLADVGRLDGLVVASPANPTGTMIHAVDLARLVEYCRGHRIRLISDEIYHGITYETASTTARAYAREAVIVNSFSKYYCMTGWRLGWMLVPPDLARSVECLAQNFYISPPALSQLAALPVFDCRTGLDAHVRRYRQNRDLLIRALASAGLSRLAPAEGAFYLYVDISSRTRDS